MLLPIILAAVGFFLLWKGYGAAIKRDNRFSKGSKFVLNATTVILWVIASLVFAAASFFINHA